MDKKFHLKDGWTLTQYARANPRTKKEERLEYLKLVNATINYIYTGRRPRTTIVLPTVEEPSVPT